MPNINLSQKSISLDLQHTGYTNTIYAQQGDVNSRRLTISLFDDGKNYNIPKNATVSLCGTRADNTVIYRDVNSFDQNVVTINFENAELAVKGIAKYKIEIKTIENGETKLLTSSLFKIKVYENIYDEDGKIASPQYSDLQRELDKIHEQENAIKEAEENREQAEEIRKNSETERVNNENQRKQAETNRINAENNRITEENKRQKQEGLRVGAETQRNASEAKRQKDTATAISNAEKATKSTNDATTKANNATNDLQNKLNSHHFVLTEDKDIAGGVPSLDSNIKVPIAELYEATTTSKGITQLTDSVTSDSTTTAATPNSVKSVKDSLKSEINRAKSAESTLTTNLNAEITRAKNAENTLSTNKLDKTTVATSSTLGLVKSGTDITVDTSGNVSVNNNSHKHTVSNISDLTATASELNVLDGITATTQELNYTDGVTSNIQTQLNSKSANGHTHDDRYYTESEIDTTVSNINDSISSHTGNTSNPHSVTKAQVGLGNVENKSSTTIRGEITKSNVTTALGYTPLNQSLKGSASGLAELDSNGKVPSSQLPSFVDDVVEGYLSGGKFYKESAHTTEISGESGKIYIDLPTGKTYRWSGSAFVVISETLALGETSSTAYRGDRGKTAYDHSQSTHARTDATKVEASSTNGNIKINGTETAVYTHPSGTNPHGTTKSDVGLGNVGNFKAVSTVASQGLTETEKANARANIGAGTSSFSGSYNDLSNKPTIPTNNSQLTNGAGYITSSGTAKTISDTLPISKGGTGQTTAVNAANIFINALGVGTDTPSDADYYISQFANGGTTQTSFYRRPISALWNYIKSKLATVATSGSYNDLSNKPTIPTKVGELTNDKDYATKTDVSKAIDNLEIGGRNLISNIDSNWQQGHWDDVDGNYMNYNGRICTKVGLKVSPGETYALKIYLNGVTDKHLLFRTYGSDGSFIGSVIGITNSIYTVPNNVYELRFVLYEDVTLDDLTNGAVRVKVEKGNKATDWTPAPEDTEAEIQAVDNKLTTNLLKPTLGTTEKNGVTCTNNGDGTYTLNGTASEDTFFNLINIQTSLFSGKTIKIVGCPKGGDLYRGYSIWASDLSSIGGGDIGNGAVISIPSDEPKFKMDIQLKSGTVCNKLIFKPMLTTNLNATYDDFVPYTGDTGSLNSDVAEVRKDFDEHTHDYLSLSGDNCYTTIYGGGSTGSDDGYRLIATVKIDAWTNMRSVFAVSGRHGGNGIFMIAYGCNNVTVSPSSTYCQINYYGNTSCGIVIDTRILQCYMSSDGTTLYFFYHYSDYDNTRFTCLNKCDGFIPNANGTWMTSIDESIYGTLIASTRINVAESDQNGNVINETYALLSHSHAISDVTGLQTALSGKQNIRNGWVTGAVDWNTLVTAGSYKIQGSTMTTDYHAPVGEYAFGILFVIDSEGNTNEHRVLQLYFPHNPSKFPIWYRMNNSSDGYDKWAEWNGISRDADTVDGEHASAFAHLGTDNDLTTRDNEFNFVSSGFSGDIWLNYRTAGGENGNITGYYLGNGHGGKLGTIIHSGNIGSQSVNYANTAGSAPASDVYAWAKASSKPSYSWDEITSKPSTFTPSTHDHNSIYYTKAQVDAADLALENGLSTLSTGKADYETGTWSPTISNSSVSCIEGKSPYVKIGSIVLLWAVVDVNTTNEFGVNGFPIHEKSILSACIFDIDTSDNYNSGKLIRDGSAYPVYFQCPTGCKRIFIIYSC